MARRKPASPSLYKTDLTGYNMSFYLDAIRNPYWERRPLKFPFVSERDAANIDFSSDLERRTYGGEIPYYGPREKHGHPFGKYTIKANRDYSTVPYRYINRSQKFTLPDNVVATAEGFEELPPGTLHPDWYADPEGNYTYISGNETNQQIKEQDHFVSYYPSRLTRFDGRTDNEYFPVEGGTLKPRLTTFYHFTPAYRSPTRPSVRFPVRENPTRWKNK